MKKAYAFLQRITALHRQNAFLTVLGLLFFAAGILANVWYWTLILCLGGALLLLAIAISPRWKPPGIPGKTGAILLVLYNLVAHNIVVSFFCFAGLFIFVRSAVAGNWTRAGVGLLMPAIIILMSFFLSLAAWRQHQQGHIKVHPTCSFCKTSGPSSGRINRHEIAKFIRPKDKRKP